MAKSWRRQETRLVRPFSQTARLDQCLKGTTFRLRESDIPSQEEAWILGDTTISELAPQLCVVLDRAAFQGLPHLAMDNFRLLITVDDHQLLRSEAIYSAPLAQTPGEPITFEADTVQRFSWMGRVDVSVAVVLASDAPPFPGLPFLQGHWVAKKTFAVRPEAEGRLFPLIPVPGSEFVKRWDLPSDTLVHAEVFGDLDVPVGESAKNINVFIHEDVHRVLLNSEASAAAKVLMRVLVAEINAQVLERALSEFDGDAPPDGTLLAALIARVKKTTKADFKRLKACVDRRDGGELRAIVGASTGLRRSIVSCDFKGL